MGISTHVLDTALGRPARGIAVTLQAEDGRELARGVTNDDGRVKPLLEVIPSAGVYRITFDTSGSSPFFPSVQLVFRVSSPSEHYHVPLLLSPYGYSTYRGS